MLSKDKITEFFCISDDFCKELEKEFAKKALTDSDNFVWINSPGNSRYQIRYVCVVAIQGIVL